MRRTVTLARCTLLVCTLGYSLGTLALWSAPAIAQTHASQNPQKISQLGLPPDISEAARSPMVSSPLDPRQVLAPSGDGLAQMLPQARTERRAITVVGQGMAATAADMARLQLSFTRNNPFGATPSVPNSQDLSPSQVEAVMRPIIQALVALQVPREAIALQATSVDSADIQVLLDKPTRPRVQQIVLAADRAARQGGSLFLQSTGAQYIVKDCFPLEDAARRAALSDAQNRIRALARNVGVQLGEVLFVTEFPVSGVPAAFSVCGTKLGSPPDLLGSSMPAYDPAAPTEVRVRSSISLTYAIQEPKPPVPPQ